MEYSKPILESKHTMKEFPGVGALDNIPMDFYEGEAVTLMGEDGMGEFMLMEILSGACTQGGGDIVLDRRPLPKQYSILETRGFGVAITYQELSLMSETNVMESAYVPHEPRKVGSLIDLREMYADTKEQLVKLNAGHIGPRGRVGDLSLSEKRTVEIAKALAMDCKMLIMDEFTTSLTHRESGQLFEIIGTLKARGITTIYISHRLDEIFRVRDRATVMGDGKLVGSSDVRTSAPGDIIMMMSGKVFSQPMGGGRTRQDKARNIPLLELERITDGGFVQDLNLTVYQGEVLRIGGLTGSRRAELARMTCNADPLKGGAMEVSGRTRRITNTGQAIGAGLGYLSENHKEDGLSPGLKIEENTVHCDMTTISRCGFMNWKRVREVSGNYMRMLKTKGTSAAQVVNLGGGNQQKAAIAKWLHVGCSLLIFDKPTRGIDMAAKAEMHQLVRGFAVQEGKAAAVISSEVNELVSVSDRIIVMSKGQITGELGTEEIEQNNVLRRTTTKRR